MGDQDFPQRELGGDDLGVEEAAHVGSNRVVNGFLETVFEGRERALRERARAAGKLAVGSADLHLVAEEIAVGEFEDRILTGPNGRGDGGHDLETDQRLFPVFGLLNDARDITAENCCTICVIHCEYFLECCDA